MPVRIALFEDSVITREMLTHLLDETHGYTCAGSFPDAFNLIPRIRRCKPDLILMDVDMPGINGIEALKIIRVHFPSIPVLMQTSAEDAQTIFDSICAGASGYLLKTMDSTRLVEAISVALAGGSPMSPSVATKVLRKFSELHASKNSDFNLSAREKEILEHLSQGKGYKIIADTCFISIDTVKFHVKRIYAKLEVNSKAEAVAKAIKAGLV